MNVILVLEIKKKERLLIYANLYLLIHGNTFPYNGRNIFVKLINLISQAYVSAYTSKTKSKYKLIDTLTHAIFRHNLTLIFFIAYQGGELNNP